MDPLAATVADLVEAAAGAHPDATAVVAGEGSLTYAELNARANRLASHLQSLGVGADVRVGVCLERSLDLAVALVAVLEAGGACVPLDPAYPHERLAFMVDDAAMAAVVTSTRLAGDLPAMSVPVIRVDADSDQWAGLPSTPPPRSIGPEHLAYVIYTSGSTGQPRGVMLTHRGLVNHHLAAVDLYRLGPGDRVLQFCSISFDASIEETFPTWTSGATLVYRPDDIPLVGPEWSDWLRDHRITVLNLPTAYWHAWTGDLDARGDEVAPGIRLVIVGGEKALGPAYRTWERVSGGRRRWVNVYGPTETTCMSTTYEPPPGGGDIGDRRDPPIGRPLPNTTVAVVDDTLQRVVPGAVGELLIGGAGLARGYLNQPGLTAERFVAGPDGEGRRYRTGDLVRELPSGDLEFVGRIDDQVKIRGFRVECGEVEAALARHPDLADVVVVARPGLRGPNAVTGVRGPNAVTGVRGPNAVTDEPGDKQLVAYVVPRAGAAVTPGDLRHFLADRLPTFMAPAAYAVLDALPLTANGKVDKANLPPPADDEPGPGRAGARSPAEERMAAIWARVLGVEVAAIGVDDDFFDLGGHSLLATQVIAQVREEFDARTPLQAIFEAPTVAGLVAVLEAEGGAHPTAIPLEAGAGDGGARFPLSLAQEQMWGLETTAGPPGLYNITAIHRFDAPVDEDALRTALAYLVDRHAVLRTGFEVDGGPSPRSGHAGQPYQRVDPTAAVNLAVVDTIVEDMQRLIAEQDATPFDLGRPPLFRAGLFRLDDAATRLAVTVDHLVCDGTAISLLVSEVVTAYEALAAGRDPGLAPLELQFVDFAAWQRARVTDDVLRHQLDWWAETLDGMPLGPTVPFDHLPAGPTRRVASRVVTVRAPTRAALDDVARATGSTVFVVMVAAVHALLGEAGGTTDVVVSTTLSGRNRAELEGVIGMFSGIGRIRTDLSGDPTFVEAVARARRRVLGMFENSDIPFMQVRRALLPDFPTGGIELVKALPVEFQYFHTTGDDQELFFRGQLHPLSITLLDDGTEIAGELSYKTGFYDAATIDGLAAGLERILDAVGADPSLRLSELPLTPPRARSQPL